MIRLVLFIALLAPAPVLAQSVTHPLDGLATGEYWIVYDALQSAGHLTPETKFTSVLLRPPAKATVLGWMLSRREKRTRSSTFGSTSRRCGCS